MNYRSVLYVTHHFIRYTGNLHEYFRSRSERFFVLSTTPTYLAEPCVLEEYRDGKSVSIRTYHWYKGRSVPLQYVFFFLYFIHAMYTVLPRQTLVITWYPLFCIGHTLLRRLRGCETFYWVHDYFDTREGLYGPYNWLADMYVRSLKEVYFVSSVMLDMYERRLGPWRKGTTRRVVEHAILRKEYPRNPDPDLIGMLAHLKRGMGVELAIEALVKKPALRLEIIGNGVTVGKLKEKIRAAGVESRVLWHGTVLDDDKTAAIASRWLAALAPYEAGDYLLCADPSKVKLYWQYGLPVIMTNVTHLAPKAAAAHAAAVIPYDVDALLEAVENIRQNPELYRQGVEAMRQKYDCGPYFDAVFA